MPAGWWESVESLGIDLFLLGNGGYAMPVVGESFHQAELNRIAGPKTSDGCELDCFAMLLHENDNPHDKMAIAVVIGGYIVGHLSKKNARDYRRQMAEHGPVPTACRVLIVGGWDNGPRDEGYYGVRLDMRWPIQTRRKKVPK